jgi:hypothetical protein
MMYVRSGFGPTPSSIEPHFRRFATIQSEKDTPVDRWVKLAQTIEAADFTREEKWRRGAGSNRRIKVLQTSPLPLGYRALAGLPLIGGAFQSAVANPAVAGGQFGAGDEI